MKIREATTDDAAAVCGIYAPYVRETAITFEYAEPDESEFARRIKATLENYPYLVAEEDGEVVGYAYAGRFRTREAYLHCAEASVYIRADRHGRGIGRALYAELGKRLTLQNVFTLYACITTTPRKDDAYLTDSSILFHENVGFEKAAEFTDCGYKFGQWYGAVWMKKMLVPLPTHPEPFIPKKDLVQK